MNPGGFILDPDPDPTPESFRIPFWAKQKDDKLALIDLKRFSKIFD